MCDAEIAASSFIHTFFHSFIHSFVLIINLLFGRAVQFCHSLHGALADKKKPLLSCTIERTSFRTFAGS